MRKIRRWLFVGASRAALVRGTGGLGQHSANRRSAVAREEGPVARLPWWHARQDRYDWPCGCYYDVRGWVYDTVKNVARSEQRIL